MSWLKRKVSRIGLMNNKNGKTIFKASLKNQEKFNSFDILVYGLIGVTKLKNVEQHFVDLSNKISVPV